MVASTKKKASVHKPVIEYKLVAVDLEASEILQARSSPAGLQNAHDIVQALIDEHTKQGWRLHQTGVAFLFTDTPTLFFERDV